ncbi:hypothetical protein CSKR_101886 [Clonorchis sinensis]|uniref:Uncharacterized protein n=2 Tax=Clonorchis sinensis TaxID=79923 RepID=G7Y8K8_CLOSI|nr:hypothetical protein CSKR_101886 [Clonorchis sinensis]GAA49293.1 hypothetical protein CLF_102820 [Clonorchis sinensis]
MVWRMTHEAHTKSEEFGMQCSQCPKVLHPTGIVYTMSSNDENIETRCSDSDKQTPASCSCPRCCVSSSPYTPRYFRQNQTLRRSKGYTRMILWAFGTDRTNTPVPLLLRRFSYPHHSHRNELGTATFRKKPITNELKWSNSRNWFRIMLHSVPTSKDFEGL